MGADDSEGEGEDPPRRLTAIEALESYSSDHAETVEELLEWPYRRFVKALDSWQRRLAVERVERQEDLHISALYANTNMDNPDNDRIGLVEAVREHYANVRRRILGVHEQEEQLDEQQEAFMRAGRRNLAIVAPPPVLPGENSIKGLPTAA